MIIVNKLEDLT